MEKKARKTSRPKGGVPVNYKVSDDSWIQQNPYLERSRCVPSLANTRKTQISRSSAILDKIWCCMDDAEDETAIRGIPMNHIELLVANPYNKGDKIIFPRKSEDERRQCYSHEPCTNGERRAAKASLTAIVRMNSK